MNSGTADWISGSNTLPNRSGRWAKVATVNPSGSVIGIVLFPSRHLRSSWSVTLIAGRGAHKFGAGHVAEGAAMIKLFYAVNTCSLASHIALEEAAAAYTTVRLSFANNEQRGAEYLAINPKGRVPAMVTDRGILTETPAMLAYIAQSFPEARLAPLDDPFAFAQVQAFNSYLCSTVHVAHAHRMRGERWADDPAAIAAMQRKVPQSVGACFELIERDTLKGTWVMGEGYRSVTLICSPWRGGSRATAST